MNVKTLTTAALMAALMGIAAQISIPLQPIPFTMQVAMCLFIGLILPLPLAILSMTVYLAMGAVGIPVFSGLKGGIGVLLGPTGGYLLGFWLSVVVISFLTRYLKPNNIFRCILLGAIGLAMIYIPGVAVLSLMAKLPLQKAIIVGFYQFLPFDMIKLVLAALVAIPVNRRLSPYLLSLTTEK